MGYVINWLLKSYFLKIKWVSCFWIAFSFSTSAHNPTAKAPHLYSTLAFCLWLFRHSYTLSGKLTGTPFSIYVVCVCALKRVHTQTHTHSDTQSSLACSWLNEINCFSLRQTKNRTKAKWEVKWQCVRGDRNVTIARLNGLNSCKTNSRVRSR